MAIKLSDFKQTKYVGLYKSIKETPKGYKYLARFRLKDKIYKKILGYSKKDHLTDRSANMLLGKYKEDLERGYKLNVKHTLNSLYDEYYLTLDPNKRYTKDTKSLYTNHIQNSFLGKKLLENIQELDIKKVFLEIDKKGLAKKTQRNILIVLKAIFKFARINKFLIDNPIEYYSIKVPANKKLVVSATEKFKLIYKAINEIFKDDPFYKALYFFALSGRRKIEIFNIKWENIDFTNNYYWIEDVKNGEQQKYLLPDFIKAELLNILDERKGIVFKSQITGKALADIRRQTIKLKKYTEIEELGLHYMRNVIVSMLAENGIEAITLSGVLGHKDTSIINQYLTLNYYNSSKQATNTINSVLNIV